MDTQHESLPKLRTAQEVAESLHCHAATIRNKARNGELRGYFIGQRWLFAEADVYSFVESCKN